MGAAVVFADTLGTPHSGVLGNARILESLVYTLPEAGEYRNRDRGHRLALGYFTTLHGDHTSFSQAEADVTSDPWNRFIGELAEPSNSVPMRVRPTVWTATLSDQAVIYFQVSRQADVERGCPPLEYYSGVMRGLSAESVVVSRESGDCEGKGATSREPVALIEHSDRLFVLVSTYGWEDDGAELWELTPEGLTRVVFPD